MSSGSLLDRFVTLQSSLTCLDHRRRSIPSRLLENFQDYNSVGVDVIDDAPCLGCVWNPKFVAAPSDSRHGPGMRKANQLTSLQAAQQDPGLDSSFRSRRRRPYLTVQPDEPLVSHRLDVSPGGEYVNTDIPGGIPALASAINFTARELRYTPAGGSRQTATLQSQQSFFRNGACPPRSSGNPVSSAETQARRPLPSLP